MADFHTALDAVEHDTTGPVYDAGAWCRSVLVAVHGEPEEGGALNVADFQVQASMDGDPDGLWYTLYRQQNPSVVRNTPDNPHDCHFQVWLTPEQHHSHVGRFYRVAASGVEGKITARLLAFEPIETAPGPSQ